VATVPINQADQIEVELDRPADLPAFLLVKWPAAPSVASPDNFSDSGGRGVPRLGGRPRHPVPDAA